MTNAKTKKKKSWNVTLEVNMCAERSVNYIVESTKRELAIKKAKELCYNDGYFYCQTISCEEV